MTGRTYTSGGHIEPGESIVGCGDKRDAGGKRINDQPSTSMWELNNYRKKWLYRFPLETEEFEGDLRSSEEGNHALDR